jgi:hypothetical protein
MWVRLFENYRLAGRTKQFLHFEKTAPETWRQGPPAGIKTGFGETVVPPGEGTRPIWLTGTIERTLFGRLFEFLFKIPAITLVQETAAGEPVRQFVSRGQLRAGVLVSPAVRDIEDLARLAGLAAGGDLSAIATTGFHLEAGTRPHWFYDPEIRLALSAMIPEGAATRKPD